MEPEPLPWSLRNPINVVALGTIWVIAAIAAVAVGYSWMALAIAAASGVLMGLLYSRVHHVYRILAFAVLFGGMTIGRHLSIHDARGGRAVLVDLQFLAVALTIALLTRSAVRSIRK